MCKKDSGIFYHREKRVLFEGTVYKDIVYPLPGSIVAYIGPGEVMKTEPEYWKQRTDLDAYYYHSQCLPVDVGSPFEKCYNKCIGI